MYGALFHDLLSDYTHWGWMDTDTVMGDLSPLIEHLKHYDVVTYPDGMVRDWLLFEASSCDIAR